MACQALNSFTELLFNENQQDADADIENLRQQMDIGSFDDDHDIEEEEDGIVEDDSPAKIAAAAAPNTTISTDDVPKELTIAFEVPTTTTAPVDPPQDNHSQAAEEAIFACRSADVVDEFENDLEAALDVAADAALGLVGVNNTVATKGKNDAVAANVNVDTDACTVETSPLDVTQDSSSASSLFASSSNSGSGSDKANPITITTKSRSKTNSVGRSRSHRSSLKNLTANLSSKANQLRELDTLVSWQSRRTCKLSDPVASANYDESVEITAVDITLKNNTCTSGKRGEDPPEQLFEEVKEDGMVEDNDNDDAPEPSSDLEPSPEQKEWSENYSKLADQYHQHGGSIAHLTQSRTAKPNVEYYNMRMFVDQQRKAADKGMLTKQQIVQLVAVGVDFDNNDNDDEKRGDVVIKEKKESADSTNPTASNDNDDDDMKEISQCASF